MDSETFPESPFAAENRALALEIAERIKTNTGIPIQDLLEKDLDAREIHAQFIERIIEYVERKNLEETPSEHWPLAGQKIDARTTLFGSASGVNVIPNLAVTEARFHVIKTYSGRQVNDFVKGVTDRLSTLKDGMTPAQAAETILGSGLAALGVAMIVATVKALAAGATLSAAVLSGVVALGSISVVVGVALVIVAGLLLYLLILNKKIFLGMVFNNTGLNLIVDRWRNGTDGQRGSDLFMSHGYMRSFMETNETPRLDSPLVQVKARDIIAPGDPDNLISGAIFIAEKNFGLFGNEGTMVFRDRRNGFPRFALLFACPYTLDNGANVRIDQASRSAQDYFNALYGSRGLDRTARDFGYIFQARVANPRGGEAAGLAVLEGP